MNKDIQTLIEREAKEEYEEYLHGTSDVKEFLDMDDLLPLSDALKACEIATNTAINKTLSLFKWRKVSDEFPPLGEEVVFYNPAWVDEDFNPKGTRIGFRLEEDYVTSYYWSHQDCYLSISHSECDNNPSYSEKIRSSIEPTEWMPIPQID